MQSDTSAELPEVSPEVLLRGLVAAKVLFGEEFMRLTLWLMPTEDKKAIVKFLDDNPDYTLR